ncbi:LysR family transcriptional regulator [Nocardiopsis sp. CNT-189]|uniref:LysR family transcriptional regulator n=1 Tax=Nocardiopsis oceanisediminis TaxID=2816862 RepID=UPI003B2CFFE1
MIDVRRLQVLRAVDRHGTVTAAARALHLTPSAVSQQVRQLARELDVELLSPEGRGIRLTSEAHVLLRHADALSAGWERALADLAAHGKGETGRLSLIGYPTAIATLIVPAAARIRAERPGLELVIGQFDDADVHEELLGGRADIAVTVPMAGGPPVDDPRFEQLPLFQEPQDLFVPAGHPLAGQAAAELSEAARESWIESTDECHHREVVRTACSAAGFTPRTEHRASEWIAVFALIAHGMGVTLGPRLLQLPGDGRVVRVPLKGEVTPVRSVFASVRRGSAHRPAVAHGLDGLRRVAAELSASLEPAV